MFAAVLTAVSEVLAIIKATYGALERQPALLETVSAENRVYSNDV